MSDPAQHRIFLERRSYQRRRLIDAVRLLPILGILLWGVPLIWARASADGPAVSVVSASAFIFAVWILLIVIGALISRKVMQSEEDAIWQRDRMQPHADDPWNR